MGKYSSADCLLYWNGYDLTGYSSEITIDERVPTQDVTTLGDSWREHEAIGLKEADITHKGFYDTAYSLATDGIANLGLAGVGVAVLAGNTLGRKLVGFAGPLEVGYSRQAAIGSLVMAENKFSVSSVVEEGKVQQPFGTITATGEGSALDNAASSANGGAGYLEVTALTLGGYTSITVKIRHSADDVTYADKIDFTAVTTVTDERVAVTGTINRYTKATWTLNGAGAGPSMSFIVGLVRS